MDGPVIRRALAEDAPALAAAQRAIAETPGLLASRPDEIHEEELRRTILALDDPRRGVFLVAEEGGALVGHGLLHAHKLAVTSHVADLTLAVHEGHQGRGVGTQLMGALIEWARESTCIEKIELRVRASNARAISLYRTLGFVEEGRFAHRIKLGPARYVDDVAMGLWVGLEPAR